MPSQQQSLAALQAVDHGIDQYRQRIRALQAELSDDAAVRAAHDHARQAQEELRAAEEAVRNGEETLGRLDRAITMLSKRLYDGSIHNSREATSVEDELAHRRVEHDSAETALLTAMERVEEAQATLARAQERLTQLETTRAGRVPALKAEGRDATARLKDLQAQRAALGAATPPAILSRYERVRAATSPAVVAINHGACGGCGVAVSTAQQQKIAADEIVQCVTCGRLLTRSGE